MQNPSGKENQKNEAELFDRVVIQILVPRYTGLNQICFKDKREDLESPLVRGRFLGAITEYGSLEIHEGVITLSLVLN